MAKLIVCGLVLIWAVREWQASRRMKLAAKVRGRARPPISEESYTARLLWTIFTFVFACVLYQVNPDLLLAISFTAAPVLLVLWTLTR